MVLLIVWISLIGVALGFVITGIYEANKELLLNPDYYLEVDNEGTDIPYIDENGEEVTKSFPDGIPAKINPEDLSNRRDLRQDIIFTIDGEERLFEMFKGEIPNIKSVECSEEVPSEHIVLELSYRGRDREFG